MKVIEVIFNTTGAQHRQVRELEDVVRENPYDAKDIIKSLDEGKQYVACVRRGEGLKIARA